MAPRKKAKKNEKTVKDFALMLETISDLYESKGDVGRSKSFATAAANITAFADLTNRSEAPLRSTEDFKDVKGVGKSTLDVLDEFIETGTCARLHELEESEMAIEEILEKREERRKKELYAMSEPDDKETAKAFCMIQHKYMEQRKKEAKQLINKMDVPMRVLVAKLLLEDEYVPYGDWKRGDLCYHCDLVQSEDHSGDCLCDTLRSLTYAEELGCENLPEFDDSDGRRW